MNQKTLSRRECEEGTMIIKIVRGKNIRKRRKEGKETIE